MDNIAAKLCALAVGDKQLAEAKEWRLLGQEQNGILLFSWTEMDPSGTDNLKSRIGSYNFINNTLDVLQTFNVRTSVIQASLNASRTILAFVVKEPHGDDEELVYKPYLLQLTNGKLLDLNMAQSKQIFLQFLYNKKSSHETKQTEEVESFLLFVHEECIIKYKIAQDVDFSTDNLISEHLVKVFIWAQWDAIHQILYYIHYRKPIKSLVDDTESSTEALFKLSPTLSGLQFHDDLPYETVLNIPLNLPHLSNLPADSRIYEDDTVPLRVHNCSLDLIVLTDKSGAIFVCHHYLYQPIQPTIKLDDNSDSPVHFAYSVTALHQSCIIHCVIPGIAWNKARTIRPLFKLYDNHLLIFIPTICMQLLDIGMIHEPANHITTTATLPVPLDKTDTPVKLVSVTKCGNASEMVLNVPTLDVFDMHLSHTQLISTFRDKETSLSNKIAILHYFLVHLGEYEVAELLLIASIDKPMILGYPQLLKEYLICSAYAKTKRTLPTDTYELVELLPITTQRTGCEMEVRISKISLTISQDALWNATMMLLSPQQRVAPYRIDIWVKLWDHLIRNARSKVRFRPSQVVDKLLASLGCYQPEALSRSSTPMSPCASISLSSIAVDLSAMKSQIDSLPFYEMESCTASKQEHVISVNLRELSMHLLKQSTSTAAGMVTRPYQWQTTGSQTPMHVHAVATRYIGAQLEQSRHLCQILCRAATMDARYDHDRGFVFIDQLPHYKRHKLFSILERYYLATESIAYPVPLGFTPFFTFLGYRTLEFPMFVQYIHRHVLELHIDVMKIIMNDLDDTNGGIKRKLKLLTMLPRSRAKRLINQWNHPISLMIRAREHATNILSGVSSTNSKGQILHCQNNERLGLAAYPSADRLSPLDTFLDLLTAKANLTELDFGLLIEATVASTEDFIK